MHERHQALAAHVLEAFTSGLDDALVERIGEVRLQQLHDLIGEALSQELEHVSGRVQALLDELRAETDRPAIEL